MSNLVFAWPYAALCLLLLIPLMWWEKKRGCSTTLSTPMTLNVRKIMILKTKYTWSKMINWPMTIFWMLLVIALMRPQYVGKPIEITRDGRNIMLVLDISESMEAQDMRLAGAITNRLVAAKNVMTDFIDKRHGDRIGLVVFGSESFLHAPLSFDLVTIKRFLDDAQIGFAGPKTAIGDAIGLSVKKLIEQTQGEKVMILLTDGQNNMGALEPMQAANIAKKHDVKIYIVGLGSSRMVVDGFFGPTAINPSLALDEAEPELKKIASLTEGKYFRARDHATLANIYREVDKLEPVKADPVILIPRKDLFYWPLSLLVILMLVLALVQIFLATSSSSYFTRFGRSRS
jgi:Ca-activated chloride channel homolog